MIQGETLGDLDAAYKERGRDLVQCEKAREAAVQTLIAERELQDRWRAEQTPRRSIWPF